jgi:hypothetical protein
VATTSTWNGVLGAFCATVARRPYDEVGVRLTATPDHTQDASDLSVAKSEMSANISFPIIMNGRGASRQSRFGILWLFLLLFSFQGNLACQSELPVGPSATPFAPVEQAILWDVVVLGRIDACWVCQNGPPPHVSYTRVLAGKVPSGKAKGQIDIVEVPAPLLPQGGIPIYRSEREEIIYLDIVVLPSDKNVAAYKVGDVKEATAANLAKFTSVGKQ